MVEVGYYLRSGCSCLHVVVGEVLSEVIHIDALHRVIIVVDLHEVHHIDFSREVFGVFFFVWGWQG